MRAEAITVAHSFDFYSNLLMIPVARWAGVPVVIGSHRQLGNLLTPLQFELQLTAFRLCDYVVCNSRAAADLLANKGLPASELVVIPNMLPPEAFAEAAPAIPRVPGVQRVGMIARMNHKVKNQAGFLRAAARLSRKFPALEFYLVGDGPLRAGLELLAEKLGLRHRATFLGERHDIPAVLASLDLTVLPSLSESMPNAILESLAAGVPVVATRVGGIPEVVEPRVTGLLVPPNDEDRFVEAVESLLTDAELLETCRRGARQSARTRFHRDRVREQFTELYLAALRKKSHGSARAFDIPRQKSVDYSVPLT
jgi:glycosyltransferase involved in cell wall biosynthesis